MDIQLIGEGNTAEVYTWNENEILKLFRKEFPMEGIEKEYKASCEVWGLGLPTPRVGEVVVYQGRTGIVYERIQGISLMSLLTKQPWYAGRYAKQMAKMHYDIHKNKSQGIPDAKKAMTWNINHTSDLSEERKQQILQMLEVLPEGDSICHGDFHPGNIMKASDKFMILDWMTAAYANPCADVARTLLLLKDSGVPDYMPRVTRMMISLVRGQLARKYLKQYLRLSGYKKKDIDQWRIPVIAARLTEWIPESERKALIEEINETISIS